jgi:hypothetical protein
MSTWPEIERRKNYCGDHPNCVYRIELLETWRDRVENKLDAIQKLLIANLAGIIATLLSALIAAGFYIARHLIGA